MKRLVFIFSVFFPFSFAAGADSDYFHLPDSEFIAIKKRLEEEHIVSRLLIAYRFNQSERILLRRLEELNPESSHLFYFRGLESYEIGEKRVAFINLSESLRREPEHLAALNLMGLILSEAGRFAEARECFHKALLLSPYNPTVVYNYANALYRLNDFRSALEQIDLAIRYRMNFGDAYHLKGRIKSALGEEEEALGLFATAKKTGINSPQFIRDYILLAESLNRYDLLASLSILLDQHEDIESLRVGAHCNMIFGDYEKAFDRYTKLIRSGHAIEEDRADLIKAGIKMNLTREKIISILAVEREDRKSYSEMIDGLKREESHPVVRDPIVNPAQ
jgi:tetratricopeptide (TPR) repeat protein